MDSVSRLGLATEPESRWSRPITTGADSSPLRTISLNARPSFGSLTQADPADARRQALKADALAGHVQPVVQVRVVRDQFLDLGVGLVDVLRVARQRDPAERTDTTAEQRADVGRHETGEIEGIGHADFFGHLTNVVAVVEGRNTGLLEREHGFDVFGHRLLGGPTSAGSLTERARYSSQVQPLGR